MIEVEQYIDPKGINPFESWLLSLDRIVQGRIVKLIDRVQLGNLSSMKGVGLGVFELRLHFGPGYRIYCGKDGDKLVILLGGGTKKRQQLDIQGAQLSWQDYKSRKRAHLSRRASTRQ